MRLVYIIQSTFKLVDVGGMIPHFCQHEIKTAHAGARQYLSLHSRQFLWELFQSKPEALDVGAQCHYVSLHSCRLMWESYRSQIKTSDIRAVLYITLVCIEIS